MSPVPSTGSSSGFSAHFLARAALLDASVAFVVAVVTFWSIVVFACATLLSNAVLSAETCCDHEVRAVFSAFWIADIASPLAPAVSDCPMDARAFWSASLTASIAAPLAPDEFDSPMAANALERAVARL